MMLYQCDLCGEKDIIENADFVHIGDVVLCKRCYGKIVKSEALDEVLDIIDERLEYIQEKKMDEIYRVWLTAENAVIRNRIEELRGNKE